MSKSCGENPERPGVVKMGTLIAAVPVTGFAENFSPISLIAPPPLGSAILGKVDVFESDVVSRVFGVPPDF